MYVYIQSEARLWTVGFYDPQGKWHPDHDFDTPEKAADRVAWLNGSHVVECSTINNEPADYSERWIFTSGSNEFVFTIRRNTTDKERTL
jgi:hypothetical protein